MVFRINTSSKSGFQQKLESLRETLVAQYPVYADTIAGGASPREADQALLDSGTVSETDMQLLYCKIWEVEPLSETDFQAPAKFDEIDPEYLHNHHFLPLRWSDTEILLAASDPYELWNAAYVIKEFSGKEVSFEFCRRSMLERLLESIYFTTDSPLTDQHSGSEDELLRLAGEAGIVRIVNEMLTQALEQNASDIHIEPSETELNIRFRVDGILQDYLKLPVHDYPAIASRIKLVSGLNIAESRLPQDGRTNFQIANYNIDIRISTIPVMNGESIVLRILHKDAMRFDLDHIGMNEPLKKRFEKLINIPHGIILVVGPTGSGKTTTLYSVMNQLNVRKLKIITIEDPVEYQLPGLAQMQVNAKIGLTFANGLRHIVRQDPDVILVGEIRDRETADIAVNAALTGHLVLSTLHTNDAAGAVTRLLDMGIEPFLISASLFGVLSQRLVRMSCKTCGGSGEVNGSRCRQCSGTGYHGRTGIFELLMINDEIRQAIHNKVSGEELAHLAVRNGMIPLMEDGMEKVRTGITTHAEILRQASVDTGEE